MWINILFLAIGAILGFLGTIGVERIRIYWEEKAQEKRNKKMLLALKSEIEEGIERCKALINFANKGKISFSRVYTAFWDSVRFELSQSLKDVEILRLLHRIYYYLDLINFNMERDRFLIGAAFAKEYLVKIEENFNKFVNKIKDY